MLLVDLPHPPIEGMGIFRYSAIYDIIQQNQLESIGSLSPYIRDLGGNADTQSLEDKIQVAVQQIPLGPKLLADLFCQEENGWQRITGSRFSISIKSIHILKNIHFIPAFLLFAPFQSGAPVLCKL